ncbi:MAG: M14 family zinc carboxypeptidase [candidate division Zixibacteria bacterium]
MRQLKFMSVIAMFCLCLPGSILSAAEEYAYRAPEAVSAELQKIARDNKDVAELHNLAVTPGGRDFLLLELNADKKTKPAILVVANMEANYPIATEAAVKLSELLVGDWKEELNAHAWYIVAMGNPDGYASFFDNPRYTNFQNAKPFNDDKDDATNEDGPEDLNGDGFITKMRQKHPEGRWIPVSSNPLFMKKAKGEKGEIGMYRLFPEGLDNDKDGKINEDGPGGVNPGHNFPHKFQHYTKTDGFFAASEAETRAILRFAFDHPEIAMVIVLGRSNTLHAVPVSSNRTEAAGGKHKLPGWMARRVGVDPEQKYEMAEIVEMAKSAFGDDDMTEDDVVRFLGLGAAVNPNKNDIPYWKEITKKYEDFLKEAELDAKSLDKPKFSNGSVEEWAYYQYGVPTFCMDFWTLLKPEKKKDEADSGAITPDDIEEMSNEEFIELGEEKISEILEKAGAPDQYSAERIIKGLESGRMDTKRMAKMLSRMKKDDDDDDGGSDTEEALYALNPDAFVAWTEYDHPTLGKVEIGGMIPYSTVLPPADKVDELIARQLPFLRKLASMTPSIKIEKVDIEKLSSEVWKVEAWVVNNGFLPYPTYQGKRCGRPIPVVVTINNKDIELLQGKARTGLDIMAGSGGYEKVRWVIKAPGGKSIALKASGPSLGEDSRSITLKGGAQ